MVAIWMLTYNHENYVAQCINSIINQKTNFDFKLFIGEDCSRDDTRNTCIEFARNFPDKIKIYLNEKNDIKKNLATIYSACFESGAKYIAMCEGDDYWCDKYKLQKQVDFLEANEDYAICFSGYKIKNELNNEETMVGGIRESISIEQIIAGNSFSTATSMFVSKYLQPIPIWFDKMSFGDWTLYILVLYKSKKKAYCLGDVTAVYRIHSGGIHGSLHKSNSSLVSAYKMHINFYRQMQAYLFKKEYSKLIAACIDERKKNDFKAS